ncbi:helix-turn-helix domain-containing protein [Nitrosospira sp. Is2]|uniref:winged helix-turn-helix transcriptional regulator n=1 Tax=Nitrosospira sp. Is2 TaxID=3080532 RepID=UPI002953A70B|nr:helix-turn-helix domain-containing protein [Nitrosospira sp. Is2]WON73370.1 helix-turn-helix domain-containing protein [Nitrosospira sp. Is2]
MNTQVQPHRSSCPVSCALDILGDKWTLLVLRDILFKRKRYFREFLTSPEKIASNILADRLRKLEAAGMILRRYDPSNGCKIAYSVTEKGIDLIPAILELLRWGAKHEVADSKHDELIEQFDRNPEQVIAEIRSSLGVGSVE